MRIAYFTDTFLPQINGIATSLANQATELGARGHSVLIFTPKLDDIKRSKFIAKNVHLIHLPTVPALVYTEYKLGVFGLPRVVKHLSKFDPDIIHFHSPFTVGMDAVMASKLLKIPLVSTVHIYFTDTDYLRWIKSKLAVKLLDKVAQRYLNFVYNQCDLVLAPSKMLVKELNGNGFKKPIAYLPNGITLKSPKFLSTTEKQLQKIKYNLKEKVILHFGRLSYEKNIDVLIKSFYLLTKNHQNISLLIIGDGPATNNLKKLVKKLKIEKEVVFTGFLDHQFLINSGFLSIGDVFATASTMEVNPMAVLEAMLYGLPIVGIQQAGLIELISSNGYLAKAHDIKELAQCMDKILFNQKLADKMRQKSMEKIKQYSISKSINQLLSLYQSLKSRDNF